MYGHEHRQAVTQIARGISEHELAPGAGDRGAICIRLGPLEDRRVAPAEAHPFVRMIDAADPVLQLVRVTSICGTTAGVSGWVHAPASAMASLRGWSGSLT